MLTLTIIEFQTEGSVREINKIEILERIMLQGERAFERKRKMVMSYMMYTGS